MGKIKTKPCPTWNCVSIAVSSGADISKIPGCHLLQKMENFEVYESFLRAKSPDMLTLWPLFMDEVQLPQG